MERTETRRQGDREQKEREYRCVRCSLVSVLCRVILGRDDQTTAFSGATIDRFEDINHLLLVLESPVDLVVITSAQIDHHMLVTEEEHHGAGIVQLVHLIKVGHFRNVHQIDHSKVLDLLGNPVEHFVHLHTGRVPIVSESDHHHTILFRQDRLIDLPAIRQMLQHIRHSYTTKKYQPETEIEGKRAQKFAEIRRGKVEEEKMAIEGKRTFWKRTREKNGQKNNNNKVESVSKAQSSDGYFHPDSEFCVKEGKSKI